MPLDLTIPDLELMGAAANYRGWMFRRVAPHLGARILEVGAGIGNFTELLLERSFVLPTDKLAACVEYLQRRLGPRLQAPAVVLDLGAPLELDLSGYAFDTVVCINVLEHVLDDRLALATMRRALPRGGKLVLLVPALQFLFGTVDVALGHHRRYGRAALAGKCRDAGFALCSLGYFNLVGVLGWFVNNRITGRRAESPRQLAFFDRFIAPYAEQLERRLPPPLGLSLIALAEAV